MSKNWECISYAGHDVPKILFSLPWAFAADDAPKQAHVMHANAFLLATLPEIKNLADKRSPAEVRQPMVRTKFGASAFLSLAHTHVTMNSCKRESDSFSHPRRNHRARPRNPIRVLKAEDGWLVAVSPKESVAETGDWLFSDRERERSGRRKERSSFSILGHSFFHRPSKLYWSWGDHASVWGPGHW